MPQPPEVRATCGNWFSLPSMWAPGPKDLSILAASSLAKHFLQLASIIPAQINHWNNLHFFLF